MKEKELLFELKNEISRTTAEMTRIRIEFETKMDMLYGRRDILEKVKSEVEEIVEIIESNKTTKNIDKI